MNKDRYKDTDLREALRRREAKRQQVEVPDDFYANIMQEIASKKETPRRRRWMAAAAGLLLIIGVGATMLTLSEKETATTDQFVETKPQQPKPTDGPSNDDNSAILASTTAVRKNQNNPSLKTQSKKEQQHPNTQTTNPPNNQTTNPPNDQPPKRPVPQTTNLQYAAYTAEEDSNYQAPSHMNEFIAKLADYYKVKAVALKCTSDRKDSTVVSTAYVFEDKQELDLFARLLQAACWYDSKTPGYLLNFSHQQFFFTLKDLRKRRKYLWIADRLVSGRILLFSTHTPIEADVSLACYQTFREQLTHINTSTFNF